MGYPDPPPAVSRRYPDGPVSVAAARRFVGAALDGAPAHLVGTAQLLASELVTNAVLHARTEVEVSVARLDGRVRVRVGDRRPNRALVPQRCSPYAGTGQGLALVEQLASRFGADGGDAGKTVWFELWHDGPAPPSAGWETTVPPRPAERPVALVDVPAALESACRQHRHAVLRELTLAAFAGDRLGVPSQDLVAATDVNNVISAGVTAMPEEPVPESGLRTLLVPLSADAPPAVRALRRVLDLAEARAREELLLTLPALPRGRAFQDWLFDEITGQLTGARPTAWTVVPPGAGGQLRRTRPVGRGPGAGQQDADRRRRRGQPDRGGQRGRGGPAGLGSGRPRGGGQHGRHRGPRRPPHSALLRAARAARRMTNGHRARTSCPFGHLLLPRWLLTPVGGIDSVPP